MNVTATGGGYTWTCTNPTEAEKVDAQAVRNTAVVIFKIDADSGAIKYMVTPYPGRHAKEFNCTATA